VKDGDDVGESSKPTTSRFSTSSDSWNAEFSHAGDSSARTDNDLDDASVMSGLSAHNAAIDKDNTAPSGNTSTRDSSEKQSVESVKVSPRRVFG
jgi:hypothetical protein